MHKIIFRHINWSCNKTNTVIMSQLHEKLKSWKIFKDNYFFQWTNSTSGSLDIFSTCGMYLLFELGRVILHFWTCDLHNPDDKGTWIIWLLWYESCFALCFIDINIYIIHILACIMTVVVNSFVIIKNIQLVSNQTGTALEFSYFTM